MPDLRKEAQKLAAERQRCRTDKQYLASVLGYDFQPCHDELFNCFVQYDVAKAWDEQSDIKDRLILWSRGHYKTTAVIVDIIQSVLNFPDIRILIMQGSLGVTKNLLREIRSHFLAEAEGSRLHELFPEFCGNKKALGSMPTMAMTTPARRRRQLAQATITVASPRSVKTGQHYDAGYFDDLVNDQNYRNPRLLDKTKGDFTLAQSLIDPGGYRCVSGTRYAFGDLAETILRWQAASKKWLVSITTCWTKETENLPDDRKEPRFPRFTKRNGEKGGFTREILLQMQKDDPATFACQQLNKPVHESQQAFTEEGLDAARIAFSDTPVLSQGVLMVDLASGETSTADDSVIMAGKIDTLGNAYLCDIRGDRWTPLELAMNCIEMCLRHRPLKIVFEGTASCKYFVDYLRLVAKQRNVFLPIDVMKVDTKAEAKSWRVKGLAGAVSKQKFKFLMGLARWDKLKEQAINFPRWPHDDYIDTAALLYIQLSQALLSLPMTVVPRNKILGMMQSAEQHQMQEFIKNQFEGQQEQLVDCTGLE